MYASEFSRKPAVITTFLRGGEDLSTRDDDGTTTLIYAAESNRNPAIIMTLIRQGAGPNARAKDGRTPLMWAAGHNRNPEVITTFGRAGAVRASRRSPRLSLFAEYNGKGFGVDVGESPRTVRDFVKSAGIPVPIVLDETTRVSALYGARAFP